MTQLIREQFLPISIEEAWQFFSAPANLNLITPPNMHFKVTCELPDAVREGLIITYKVAPLLGIPLNWRTRITEVNQPFKFADVQEKGPYKFWKHEHYFQPADGGVLMKDVVSYEIGKSIFGKIAGWLFVHNRVKEIFEYRRKILINLFPVKTPQ